ncbi:hypothetical protein MRY82_01985 [bacterium]|nr:hypothetical protein [bacterium]
MFNAYVRNSALIFLIFTFISIGKAQTPNQFGFVSGNCKFADGDTINVPFFYSGKGYLTKILDVPTLQMNYSDARSRLPDSYQDSCLAYFFNGCRIYKAFKEFNIPPMENIASAMSYQNLSALKEIISENRKLIKELALYSVPSPLITRFNNLTCLPGGKIDDIQNNPNPERIPDPNDVLPVIDDVLEPYFRTPQLQPNIQPGNYYIPELESVIQYIRDNWNTFALSLTLALIGALAVYVGVNGVPAIITGGASLPSFGATAPILAATLVAILVQHGAWQSKPNSNSGMPSASVHDLMIEINEEHNTFIIKGKVNGVDIEQSEINLDDIKNAAQQIKTILSNDLHLQEGEFSQENSSNNAFNNSKSGF